jgi:hypothetical protein
MILSPLAKEELEWWLHNLVVLNGKPIEVPPISLMLETDASKKGWGGRIWIQNQGYVDQAAGMWTAQEQTTHINVLELQAAWFTLQALVIPRLPQLQIAHIQCQMDNSSAVAYLNRMGGTHSRSLNNLSKKMWNWAMSHSIHLSAVHIAGVKNTVADRLSREFSERLEWMLDRTVFLQLTQRLGYPQVDLFASRINRQIPRFVSWRPDPEAWKTDAFSINWSQILGYAFPPFNLILKVLKKVQSEGTDLLLITPQWPTQPWYPMALEMAILDPVLLPGKILHLPNSPEEIHYLEEEKNLRLIAWLVSGDGSKVKDYQRGLQKLSLSHGELKQISNTHLLGPCGLAGATRGKWIPFDRL